MRDKRRRLTAKQLNEMALRSFAYRSDGEKRSLPTIEQSREYVQIVDTLFASSLGYQGDLTEAEVHAMQFREDELDHLQLDMRYQVFEEHGMRGLKHPSGYIVVPPRFDDVPELYDAIGKSWGPSFCVPVIRNGKYALYSMGRPQDEELYATPLTDEERFGQLLTEFDYDGMYRFFGTPHYFVVEKDGKKGVIDASGRVIIPIEQEEIFGHSCFAV